MSDDTAREIFEQLRDHGEKLSAIATELKNLRCAAHDAAINGNGRDGLLVRVDRLERSEQLRSRWEWALKVAAITSVFSTIGGLLLMLAQMKG